MRRSAVLASMPVHLSSAELTPQAWDAPGCTGGFLQGRPELLLRLAVRRCIAAQQAGVALRREEGGQQHVEVVGAAVQPLPAQGALGGLHHGDDGAVGAGGTAPGSARCGAEGGGQVLYSCSR